MVRVLDRRSESRSVRRPDESARGPAPLPVAEDELVERAKTDPDAFAELYRRHVHAVHAFAYRRSRSMEVADEITSSTFERALRALPGFRWRDGGFKAWLYRIAANELASHYRRAQRARGPRGRRAVAELNAEAGASLEGGLTSEATLDAGSESRLLLEALGLLNERYQRVITLRYLAGLSPDEAAAAMDLNKSTLAVLLHRALGALRRKMDELSREREVGQ
jgi:RNA polymerase sigma-70 factor, ECF subfamily